VSLTVLLGGARAGKSALALELARQQSAPVVYVATAEAGDDEMTLRIARHRAERPEDWRTVEEPVALHSTLASIEPEACVVVDCLTLWVANALEGGWSAARIEEHAAEAASRAGDTIAVSNEVGLGVVPATPLGRTYRDVLGRVNAIWAAAADEALFVVAGRTLELRA
jgi:adenosylcobinamide kinase / adenosylcobinamide-phosphate guanylyltransferase